MKESIIALGIVLTLASFAFAIYHSVRDDSQASLRFMILGLAISVLTVLVIAITSGK